MKKALVDRIARLKELERGHVEHMAKDAREAREECEERAEREARAKGEARAECKASAEREAQEERERRAQADNSGSQPPLAMPIDPHTAPITDSNLEILKDAGPLVEGLITSRAHSGTDLADNEMSWEVDHQAFSRGIMRHLPHEIDQFGNRKKQLIIEYEDEVPHEIQPSYSVVLASGGA